MSATPRFNGISYNGHGSWRPVVAAGINKSHGSSLCLVDDSGIPIFCASEERFTRKKLQHGMPHLTYESASSVYPMEGATLAIARLDPWRRMLREGEYHANSARNGLFSSPVPARLAEVAGLWYRKKIRRDRQSHRLSVDTKYFTGRKLDLGLDHHLCHMASAYYCAGVDEAVIVSVDGVGDMLSAVVGRGLGKDIHVDARYFQSEHISGQAYEVVTSMLGFHPDKHPGKVTGLAAYCQPPDELVAELERWFRDQYRRGSRENWFYLIHTKNEQRELERLRELRETKFGRWSREEIASAIQCLLERDVLALVRRHVQHPERHHVVLAGGVFANVKLNQRIKGLGFKSVFVQPAMGDEGTGLGAALLAAHRRRPFAPYRLRNVYLGPDYTDEQMRRALTDADLEYETLVPELLDRRLAELLHEGLIIARYQGRMEFGPRALGNRSILYHAGDPSANDWLNKQLKRSEFMPFAPVTLAEQGSNCYHGLAGCEHAAEFMTITLDATDSMRKQSPACVHVDGTARPQLVSEFSNKSLYWTLRHYRDLSGNPSIINTSFNMHEEPIVCTPAEAVKAFRSANLDALAMGDFLVINQSPEARHRRLAATTA
jgi:carbamoyltransferase